MTVGEVGDKEVIVGVQNNKLMTMSWTLWSDHFPVKQALLSEQKNVQMQICISLLYFQGYIRWDRRGETGGGREVEARKQKQKEDRHEHQQKPRRGDVGVGSRSGSDYYVVSCRGHNTGTKWVIYIPRRRRRTTRAARSLRLLHSTVHSLQQSEEQTMTVFTISGARVRGVRPVYSRALRSFQEPTTGTRNRTRGKSWPSG